MAQMTIQSGTAVWFARHESRLAWRDWLSMMTAGRRQRRRRVAIGIAIFVIFMHAVAYSVVGSFAAAPLDRHMLVGITVTVLLSWLLMVSQAMESMTRAFYARADLDLILASPVAAQKVFAVRIATVALSVAMMALPLAAPFIDMLAVRGGARWLGAYGVIAAMGAAATALAVALTVALFRAIGPRRTRLVAQIVAAVIGAAFVIGLQVAAILSYGTLSRGSVLQSRRRAGAGAGCGEPVVVAGARGARRRHGASRRARRELVAARRRHRDGRAALRRLCRRRGRRRQLRRHGRRSGRRLFAPPRRAGRCGARNGCCCGAIPGSLSQTLMQMLYLAPPAVLLWRSFAAGGGAYNLLVPVLVMAAGQLAGGLAWLTISGEDAPDLVATAPVTGRLILRAKIEAVLGIIALVFAPLLVALAVASPWHALVTASGIVIAAGSATAIQLWFRSQAKRSQFRRRQVSSRVATFAEAFSSIAWAATAAVAAVNLLLAIAPALMALIVLGGARYLSPRR